MTPWVESNKDSNFQDGLRSQKALENKDRSATIKLKSEQLKLLQEHEDQTSLEEIMKLQREIYGLMDQKDLKWKQRAKKYWYKNGDLNTKFFHTCANQRRYKNFIK